MHKTYRDMWTAVDASNVYRAERTADAKPQAEDSTPDFSDVDFEQAEQIELTGQPDINFQYFSTREEFEDRLNALMGFASKTNLSTIYGIIALKVDHHDVESTGSGSAEDKVTRFTNIFIRSLRVPRKFIPPNRIDSERRKSDQPEYTNIRGNFDLACRTLPTKNNPHLLEFVLYDCRYEDAIKKMEGFKESARDLGLSIEVEIGHYNGGKFNL